MKLIDLTQKFTASMPVYPGDKEPLITQTAFLEKDGYNDFIVKTGMHVGTHIDAPLHFIKNGKKLSEYGPEKFIGRGVLIDARGKNEIGIQLLENIDIDSRTILLVHVGWDKKYRGANGAYFTDYPVLTEGFGRALVKSGVKMVGTDTCSPDAPPNYFVQKILLGAGILIIENLTNLDQLVGVKEFEVIALPAKYDTEAAPARVVARIL